MAILSSLLGTGDPILGTSVHIEIVCARDERDQALNRWVGCRRAMLVAEDEAVEVHALPLPLRSFMNHALAMSPPFDGSTMFKTLATRISRFASPKGSCP